MTDTASTAKTSYWIRSNRRHSMTSTSCPIGRRHGDTKTQEQSDGVRSSEDVAGPRGTPRGDEEPPAPPDARGGDRAREGRSGLQRRSLDGYVDRRSAVPLLGARTRRWTQRIRRGSEVLRELRDERRRGVRVSEGSGR